MRANLSPTANNFRIFWLIWIDFWICPVLASAITKSASPTVWVSNMATCLTKANFCPNNCIPGVKNTFFHTKQSAGFNGITKSGINWQFCMVSKLGQENKLRLSLVMVIRMHLSWNFSSWCWLGSFRTKWMIQWLNWSRVRSNLPEVICQNFTVKSAAPEATTLCAWKKKVYFSKKKSFAFWWHFDLGHQDISFLLFWYSINEKDSVANFVIFENEKKTKSNQNQNSNPLVMPNGLFLRQNKNSYISLIARVGNTGERGKKKSKQKCYLWSPWQILEMRTFRNWPRSIGTKTLKLLLFCRRCGVVSLSKVVGEKEVICAFFLRNYCPLAKFQSKVSKPNPWKIRNSKK